MKRFRIYNLLFMALFLLPLTAWAEREELITKASQLSSNVQAASGSFENLLDDKSSTIWISNTNTGQTERQYIQIDFGENGIQLNSDKEDLVIRLLRHDGSHDLGDTKHPTTFEVQVSTDETEESWEPFQNPATHVYFLYRGKGTTEYSARITTTKSFRYMRLILKANNSRTTVNDSYISDETLSQAATAVRCMAVAGLQIIRLGRNENYSDKLKDRFRLISDYSEGYNDYKFENTQGVIDSRNMGRETAGWYSSNDWDNNGKWTKDLEFLKNNKIDMPDYSFSTSADDSDIEAGDHRQRTHVTEHILYAIPGDAIALYPYYDLPQSAQYQENFSHWYDYKTGDRLQGQQTDNYGYNLLDFLIDPGLINRTSNGYFAGSAMPGLKNIGDLIVEIKDADEFIAFAQRVNKGEKYLVGALTNDIDFRDKVFVPIGTSSYNFCGVFDGRGHTLKNINYTSGDRVGIFGTIKNATIQNFIVDESCEISGANYVGIIGIAENDISGGKTIVSGIVNNGKITASGINAGGIIGCVFSAGGSIEITDCAVIGTVTGVKESAAICGWLHENQGNRLTGCWSTATVTGLDGQYDMYRGFCTAENCYSTNSKGKQFKKWEKETNSQEFVKALNGTWELKDNVLRPNMDDYNPTGKTTKVELERKYGTVATFFYPRDPYKEDGEQYELPREYVIAADFSQNFSPSVHIDDENRTIIEPTIQFRHIFRIRDGHAFAEEFSGSADANKAYVKKHQRFITAREGVDFQVRLESPVPVENTTRSKYYYKISNSDYRRVCTSVLKVYNADTGAEITNPGFNFSETFNGQGSREIDGVTYNICGGGGSYYRMLACPANVAHGRYIVELIGEGYGGIDIHPFGSTEDLVVQRFHITFLPEGSAFMVNEEQLKQDAYKKGTDEKLKETYGDPHVAIDFDEYRSLVGLENKNAYLATGEGENQAFHRLKWPVKWSNSNYAFGYSVPHDYNMYTVVDNSKMTPYHAATDAITSDQNFGKTKGGLYDRRFYDTKGEEQGFFYYVNAASDPGVMAILPVEKLCTGSQLHVTAWVAECSNNVEVANLSFNLVARMKPKTDDNGTVIYSKNERVLLHSFVSGYVPREKLGKWMKIYHTFIPDFLDYGVTPADVDHYEIELDNNCKSSNGADYAIDDIRVYISKPLSYAVQKEPICGQEKEASVRIESPFNAILQAIGLESAPTADKSERFCLYYTFLDKEKYDKATNDGNDKDTAVKESRLKFQYDPKDSKEEQTYGKLVFKTHYNSNQEYPTNTDPQPNTAYRQDIDGQSMLVFDTQPYDDKGLKPGKEYIVAFCYRTIKEDEETTFDDVGDFDLDGECARTCVFRVKGATTVKIDGVVVPDLDNLQACENNSPVVQIDIWGKENGNEELKEYEKNAYLDWYAGSLEEFNQKDQLNKALTAFRNTYPDATTAADVELTTEFTQEMRDLLVSLSTPTEKNPAPKLSLHQSSYVFPPLKKEGNSKDTYQYVVAIPIPAKNTAENWIICSDPTEVKLLVSEHDPSMKHGFKEITYPMDDVPLRIGLGQLQSVSCPESEMEPADQKILYIPVRQIGGNSDLQPKTNTEVLLVETNDPAYKNLHPSNESDSEGLKRIGWLCELKAKQGNAQDNRFGVSFDNTFQFNEGYYYRMRFQFEEQKPEGSGEETTTPETPICSGQHVFTLKVVPEYQQWTGAAGNTNWNNDKNWKRVSSKDLYREATADDNFTTDGPNTNEFSYAPLDFTKVIIPAWKSEPSETSLPHLYEQGAEMKDITVFNEGKTQSYKWPANPENATSTDKEVTENIQYDMAALSYSETNARVGCRPWYLHTCDQINFRPASAIMNQQYLTYHKAWVEMELDPSRWYTLSSPLQGVVSGDMYLPKGGRQETELFTDITYKPNENSRFNPAVYQRGWNRSSATLYEIGGEPGSRNVAIKANWSSVYNDVAETYGTGTGFSIKTITGENTDNTAGNTNKKVLFRLPKSDSSFDYYSVNGNNVNKKTTSINRTNNFKLNNTSGTITSTCEGNDNQYFLVGNPFMTYLDMQKFLDVNKEKISQKYWIVEETNQKVAVFANEGLVGSATGVVAPLQGFFVEAINPTNQLELTYNENMMHAPTDGNAGLRSATRAASIPRELTVSAEANGKTGSEAFLLVDGSASQGYDMAEDAVLLIDEELRDAPLVYTVAGSTATSVNRLSRAKKVEVGVVAEADAEVTLRFHGIDIPAEYKLFDALTGEYTPIEDDMTYRVKGSSAGRLFITSGTLEEETLDGIRIMVSGQLATVTTGRSSLSVNVYDLNGRKVKSEKTESNEISFRLNSGISIIEARDEEEVISKKIIVR